MCNFNLDDLDTKCSEQKQLPIVILYDNEKYSPDELYELFLNDAIPFQDYQFYPKSRYELVDNELQQKSLIIEDSWIDGLEAQEFEDTWSNKINNAKR